jgi:ABC-type nitrate/sulfonate/bicarbonate transport system ATPase subunit
MAALAEPALATPQPHGRADDDAVSERLRAQSVLLEVRGLRHAFGAARVLDGLGFSVRHGEVFGLLGPNGCGKSTTLRVLTGLLMPDAGEILLDCRVIPPGGRALRNRVGVVFQTPSLDPRLSARESLQLSAQLQRVPRAAVSTRVAQALELAQLSDRRHERVMELSGGMKRRLELARALLHEPALLIMDEPTSGLDEVSFRRTWEHLTELRRQRGVTVLLTTHRPEEAALFLLLLPFAGFALGQIHWLPPLAGLSLTCFALCALGFAVAWWLDSTAGYHVVMSLVLLPLWMLSGALFPARPGSVLGVIASLNPLSYAVSAVRRGLYGAALPAGMLPAGRSAWHALLVLTAFVLVATLCAVGACHSKR